MGMPKIPTLQRFLCLDISTGVMWGSAILGIFWIIFIIVACIAIHDIEILHLGDSILTESIRGTLIWYIIWSLANIVVYGLAVYAILKKTSNKLLLAAICLSLFDIVVGIIFSIVSFADEAWFAAIWLLLIVSLTVYYILGLHTIYQNQSRPGATVTINMSA